MTDAPLVEHPSHAHCFGTVNVTDAISGAGHAHCFRNSNVTDAPLLAAVTCSLFPKQ